MAVIEIIGAIVGLLYLRLEYRASIWLWPAGVVMPLFYIYIFSVSKFYADAGIHVYYLLASIYGWIRWRKDGDAADGSVRIRPLPRPLAWKLSIVFAGMFGLIAWALRTLTDSPAPFGDAFTTALSIVAMWMLANRYTEQWLLWIAVNAVSTGLYLWRGLYPTAVLFAVYAVVSVFGYLKWRRMSAGYADADRSPAPGE
ncbi:MAG: nicotinamide riboside transporter PnuC [Tannerella sp.]|jgi:nicotinamide mononucleotide transporter|nr:nicotinamide riboside transporter PnuC [Tannerella sp.]